MARESPGFGVTVRELRAAGFITETYEFEVQREVDQKIKQAMKAEGILRLSPFYSWHVYSFGTKLHTQNDDAVGKAINYFKELELATENHHSM